MKLIKSSVKILDDINGKEVINKIGQIARTCYKSEDKGTYKTNMALVDRLIKSGHEAMIEHFSISVKFICDRGVSHEIVRHRMAAYAMESTRYCNYSKDKFGSELTYIAPEWYETADKSIQESFSAFLKANENKYLELIQSGLKPQDVRAVLPHCIKTELNMTANLREWRHFFKLRCSTAAHPDIRVLALDLLNQMHTLIPIIFDDIYEEYYSIEEQNN